jgi:DNA polymerase-3 subunit alpha
MGCEFYRMGVESQMSSMPILDTCTEVTASLLKFQVAVVVNFNLHVNGTALVSFNKPFGEDAHHDVEATTRFLEVNTSRNFCKEELDVPASYFKDFQNKNPSEIKLIG